MANKLQSTQQSGIDLKAKKSLLIDALKKTYKQQYDAIQPIPYIKDRLYCVDKVFVEGGTETESGIRLDSYKDIFTDSRVKAKRRIIEAEAGYGKSTVTLQLAYDWCNGVEDSPLRNVEILILLKLRQLNNKINIYKAIKMFLVSKEPRVKSSDIQSIIEACSSVEIILDGYDEYPDRDRGTGSDVGRIIAMNMFVKYDVSLTTRYLPKNYDRSNTKRVRLVGFDDKARDQYIRKAVTGDDEESVAKIKRALKDNPILDDMCQVPLFFVMFSHMTHEKTHFQNFKSVTEFFRYMIRCFHSHLRNKSLDKSTKLYPIEYEVEHSELSKVAFEGLDKKNQQLTWSKDELIQRLGQAFYNHYIAVGILVEEQVFDERNGQTKIEVRFYHKLFCEWYACFTLVETVAKTSEWQIEYYLRNLDPFDLQYLYRFSCGIDSTVGSKLIDYLKRMDGGDKFAILCILEKTGEVDQIKETIRELCSKEVTLKRGDNRLLQRSTIQLLEIAARSDIPISCVTLNQSFEQVDGDEIKLRSGLTLPKLLTVEKIHIETDKEDKTKVRELSEDEALKICAYALGSTRLKEISFGRCLLPLSLPITAQAAEIINRNIKVTWCRYGYRFDFQSGHWEVDDVNIIRRLCSSQVKIWYTDSELLQRCTIQLLKNASNKDIPISSVWLRKCSPRVSESGLTPQAGLTPQSGLILQSGLSLSILSSLQRLEIRDDDRRLTTEEFVAILCYSSQCTSLKELEFSLYYQMKSVPVESIPSSLKSRQVKVWIFAGYDGKGHSVYQRFNLTTGRWQTIVVER